MQNVNNVASLTETEFIAQFRKRSTTHRLWQHPFLERIRSGKYTFEGLRIWAIQAGRIDQAFADILGRMLKNPAIPAEFHSDIEENLQDELGHGNPEDEHFMLFRSVLGLCNVTEQEYESSKVLLGTSHIVDMLLSAASDQSNPLRIATLMASEELICPQEFPIFVTAFERLTGSHTGMRYFDEHINADVGHSEDLMHMAHRIALQTPNGFAQVIQYQQEDLDANWHFYEDMPCGCEHD